MDHPIPDIEPEPRAALASYIRELEEYYYPWYDKAESWNYIVWHALQSVAFLSGFATAIIAAVLKTQSFDGWGAGRVLLVVLPVVGTFATTYIAQSRIAELEGLRERGRQAIQRLASEARVDYAAAKGPQDFTDIHRRLVAAVTAVETEQERGYRSVAPKLLARTKRTE